MTLTEKLKRRSKSGPQPITESSTFMLVVDREEMRVQKGRLSQSGAAKSSNIRLAKLEAVAREAMNADTKPSRLRGRRFRVTAVNDLEGIATSIPKSGKPRQQNGSRVMIESKDATGRGMVREGDWVYLQCGPRTIELTTDASQCFPFETFLIDQSTPHHHRQAVIQCGVPRRKWRDRTSTVV